MTNKQGGAHGVRVLAGLGLLCATVLSTVNAGAAGLYFSDRGVRPIGRGGAFVAGADDLGALWYNPAGLADAGNAVLSDFSYLRFSSTFQRRSIVNEPDPSNPGSTHPVIEGTNYYPEVSGTTPLLPLPTLAVSNDLGVKGWNFAFGAMAPYATLTSYPEESISFRGMQVPAPQRYSLITLNGSALVLLGTYAAFKPSPQFALGFGLQALVGNFNSRLAFSACPPKDLLCAGEQPDYDAYGQLNVGMIVAPTGNFGAIATLAETPTSELRLGLSFQLPIWVSAPATVKLRLPSSALFRNATVDGDQAHVSFRLPPILRAGIETRLGAKKDTRLELAVFYEGWSMHDDITIAPAGDGIRLRGVTGLPDLTVGELKQARGFRDTFSIHGGGEQRISLGGYDLELRGGVSYERSAVPPAYLSVLTVDLDKVQAGVGGSLYVGAKKQLRLDIVLAHTFAFATDVDPAEARIGRVKVVRGNDPQDQDIVKVNGGRYTASADVVGVGLNWKY
jgi:long-chain fatty acid transport protein